MQSKARTKEKNTSETSSNSDTSLTLLPENKPQEKNDSLSDTDSSISEHIQSSNDSIENDRSLQEIIVPTRFSIILQNLDDVDNISQEKKPPSLSTPSFLSDNNNSLINMNPEASNNVLSILEEILNQKDFQSNSMRESESNVSSINVFEGLNLDDKCISSYVSRLRNNEQDLSDVKSLRAHNVDCEKSKHFEDSANNEVDSLREMASNTSTMSLNTSTTEYKQLQDDYKIKVLYFV